MGDALTPSSTHETRHQAAPGNHVDNRQLLHQPQGVVPNRQDVAQQDYLGLLGLPGVDGGLQVHDAAHAEGGAVVLVDVDGVEANFLGVQVLVDVSIVELRPQLGVVYLVAQGQVLDGESGSAEIPRCRVLIGALGDVTDEHRFLLP